MATEHVVEVEISGTTRIRNLNESGRGILNAVSYTYLPSKITIHLIYFIVMWLNALLAGKLISHKYHPREIVTGQHLSFKKTV